MFLSDVRLVAVLIGMVAFCASLRAEDAPQTPAPKEQKQGAGEIAGSGTTPVKRTVVTVRNAAAADLATALTEHYKGEPNVRVVAEPGSNALLITANPHICNDVLDTLALLDRPRRRIAVDAIVLELTAETDKGAATDPETAVNDDRAFTGPMETVNRRIEALEKAGKVVNVKRMHLETIENQPGQTQAGEERSIVNGFNVNARTGLASPIVSRRPVGTIVSITPRITVRNEVLATVVFRDDRVQFPPDAVVLFNKGEDGPIIAPVIASTNTNTSMKLTPGQATLVHGLESTVQAASKPRAPAGAPAAAEVPPAEVKSKVNRLVAILVARIEEPKTGE
jgi:type II secretory pathway component GspD/PulD (secretin)